MITNKMKLIVLVALSVICVAPSTAQAMHISEGILPARWAGFWFVLAIPFIVWGLADIKRRTAKDPSFKAMAAMVGAAIFIISCIYINLYANNIKMNKFSIYRMFHRQNTWRKNGKDIKDNPTRRD